MENQYAVSLLAYKISEDNGLLGVSLGPVLEVGEDISPFNRRLTSSRWFHDFNESPAGGYDEGTWVFSKAIKEEDLDDMPSFKIQVRFASGVASDDIDSNFFFYSMGIQFSNLMKKHRRPGEPAFYGCRLEKGSTLIEFYVGAAAVAGAVTAYPKVKQGVLELISDARFLTSGISKALRLSSSVPLTDRKEPTIDRPFKRYKQRPFQSERDSEFRKELRANRGDWDV